MKINKYVKLNNCPLAHIGIYIERIIITGKIVLYAITLICSFVPSFNNFLTFSSIQTTQGHQTDVCRVLHICNAI